MRKRRTRPKKGKFDLAAGPKERFTKHAAARRSYTEGNSFDVVELPSMKILAGPFDTLEAAEDRATQFNKDMQNGTI